MTKLHKPLTREVTGTEGAPLVVTLTADGILIREKGRRKSFLMPYGYAYVRAAMLEADARRATKGAPSRRRVKRNLLTNGR